MGQDGFALNIVQCVAHLDWRILVVVQVADEGGNRPLKVDLVFPKSVVGVDEQGLPRRELRVHSKSHKDYLRNLH